MQTVWKLLFTLILTLSGTRCFADKPHDWQMGFQEAATPVMEQITQFHEMLLIIIFAIGIFVTLLLFFVIFRFRESANPNPSKTSHNTLIEVVWTLIPVIILVVIAVPSFKLLFYMDRTNDAEMTLKVVGHQWYWSYVYPDHDNIEFDSYMVKEADLKPGQLRLLDVDNPVVIPVDTNVRILVTSADVLHSWAVPAFGVKQDTIPGRLRETWVRVTKPGKYYGQCSELCGTGHGFMSIVVKAVSKEEFKEWVAKAKEKFA